MSDVRKIRGWLLWHPRPKAVRVTTAEDSQPHTIRITEGISFARIAESVSALRPELVEALGDGDQLIRAWRPNEEDDEDGEDEDGQDATPATPPDAATTDPETRRFMFFATELAKAYKHANEVAFGRLVDLADAGNRRAEGLERTLARQEKLIGELQQSLLDQAEERINERQESAGDPVTNALANVISRGAGGDDDDDDDDDKPTANGKAHA